MKKTILSELKTLGAKLLMLCTLSMQIVACDDDIAPKVEDEPTYQEEFTIMSGKVYFPEDSQTKTVKTLSQDIKEITVVESPQGWSVEIDEQGNINITSPAQGDVSAESEGYVVIKASGKGGKIIEGRFIVAKGNLEVYAYANRAYFIGGSCDYYYGASTLGGFERSVDYILSVLSMEKGTERSSLLENLAFKIQKGDYGYEGEEITPWLSTLLDYSPTLGDEYIVWAVMDSGKTGPYTIDDVAWVHYKHRSIKAEVTENTEKRTSTMIDINVSVKEADGYLAMSVPAARVEDVNIYKDNLLACILDGNISSAGKLYTEDYTGSLLEIAKGTDAYIDGLNYEPYSDYYVFVLPFDGRPYDRYTKSDIKGFQFKTAEPNSGGAVSASAQQVQYSDSNDEMAVEFTNASQNSKWTKFYYIWIPETKYKSYKTDQELVNATFAQNADSHISKSSFEAAGFSFPYVISNKDALNMTYWFVGFFVDEEGKWGELAKIRCTPVHDWPTPDGLLWKFDCANMLGEGNSTANILSFGVAPLYSFYDSKFPQEGKFVWAIYQASNYPEDVPDYNIKLRAEYYYSYMGACEYTVIPNNETSGIVRYYCMIPRFDAEHNLLKDDTGRTLFELDMEREFRYDNFDPVAKTCRFYFYDTVEGELCTVLNDSEMWFMYFGLAAAGNN